MSNQDVEMWKAINEAKAVIEEMRRVEAEQDAKDRAAYEERQVKYVLLWQVDVDKILPAWAHSLVTFRSPLDRQDCTVIVNLPVGSIRIDLKRIYTPDATTKEIRASFLILLDGNWNQVKDFVSAVGYLAENHANKG